MGVYNKELEQVLSGYIYYVEILGAKIFLLKCAGDQRGNCALGQCMELKL